MITRRLLLAALCLASVAPGGRAADDGVATLEGRVASLGVAASEGGLDAVLVKLQTAAGVRDVVLAPARALAEAEFEVRVGDELRVRVFVGDRERPLLAHKVRNATRGTMLRLRTLRGVPAWDASGAWKGGPGGAGAGFGARHGGARGRGPRR